MSVYDDPDNFEQSVRRIVDAEIDRLGRPEPVVIRSRHSVTAAPASQCPPIGVWSVSGPVGLCFYDNWSNQMAEGTRKLEMMRDWMKRELRSDEHKTVLSTERVSKYLGVDGTTGLINEAVDAFLVQLKNSDGFCEDGLALIPGDVPSDPTVNQLLRAIVADYERRDIEVIL